jgi:hypothetical protein
MDFLPDPNRLSGDYSKLAKKYGINVESTFVLGYGEEISQTMDKILQLLKETLSIVVEKASLQDLVCIEKEEFGGQEWAISLFGYDYEDCVEISLYDGK